MNECSNPQVMPRTLTELMRAERDRLAKMIEAYAMERAPGGERMVLAIAARSVRRGRRLTFAEQMDNLERAMEEADDEAAAIRGGER